MTHVLQTVAIVLCLAITPVYVAAKVDEVLAVDYDLTGRVAPEGRAEKLVVYTADWCAPCQRLKPVLKRLKEAGYTIEIVDIDRDSEKVKEKYSAVPTLFYYRSGKLVKKESGFRYQKQILEVLWKPSSSQD